MALPFPDAVQLSHVNFGGAGAGLRSGGGRWLRLDPGGTTDCCHRARSAFA